MARHNPDPYATGRIFALVNHVTAVLDADDLVAVAIEALERAGIDTGDVDLFQGAEGLDRLDLNGDAHGPVVRLARRLEAAVGDEGVVHARMEQALRSGRTLISVDVHGRPERKAVAMGLLFALGAREIHHWGRWSFEDAARAS